TACASVTPCARSSPDSRCAGLRTRWERKKRRKKNRWAKNYCASVFTSKTQGDAPARALKFSTYGESVPKEAFALVIRVRSARCHRHQPSSGRTDFLSATRYLESPPHPGKGGYHVRLVVHDRHNRTERVTSPAT